MASLCTFSTRLISDLSSAISSSVKSRSKRRKPSRSNWAIWESVSCIGKLLGDVAALCRSFLSYRPAPVVVNRAASFAMRARPSRTRSFGATHEHRNQPSKHAPKVEPGIATTSASSMSWCAKASVSIRLADSDADVERALDRQMTQAKFRKRSEHAAALRAIPRQHAPAARPAYGRFRSRCVVRTCWPSRRATRGP